MHFTEWQWCPVEKGNILFEGACIKQPDSTLFFLIFKDCSSKFPSKHSITTVLYLLRNLLERSLLTCEVKLI